MRLAALPLTLLLALGTSAPAPGPYIQIEQLELSRSLGNGRLAEFLSSNDRLVALRAALAIGRTKQTAGIPLLVQHIHDRNVAMRAMAVYGLGLIGTNATAPHVLSALRDTSGPVLVASLDATDRLETAHAFGPVQERTAAQRVTVLLRSRWPIVRARAATALESFSGSPQQGLAVYTLSRAFARERDPFVRWHIMWTLYRGYARVTAKNVLARGLRDANDVVRIQAVRAFGRRGDASAVSLLRPLLSDRSWRVQEQTRESITVLQGGKMTEHLGSIPAGVHTPAPQPDRLAYLPALPRTPSSGKPSAPQASAIITQPKLDPQNVALLTGPARGPHPRVRIVTTEGNLYLELYPEWAPLTVENFLNLANRGYYDNNPWFRIVPDFVVQTGDPTGNGNGDAGYTIPAEENPIEQDSYVISMGLNYTNPPNAHAIRDSAGTQFYITLSPQLHLDRDFTVFGKVIAGSDVLGRLVEKDKIVRVERLPDSKE
ncbi:MAG TPA: peptidylprolyl isomerase [Candidatus Baltobacteraceae bacterium]|nr:peptidylprolyl isomerase [Candidatus Baltobacteraceae bacterium]